jgi:hypothetical protein
VISGTGEQELLAFSAEENRSIQVCEKFLSPSGGMYSFPLGHRYGEQKADQGFAFRLAHFAKHISDRCAFEAGTRAIRAALRTYPVNIPRCA